MTIQERFEALTPEQLQKLSTVKTERELDGFLAEAGIEATAEEKAALSAQLKAINTSRELTDEEVEIASGGAGWDKCPHGHYQYWFPAHKECATGRCNHYSTESGFGSGGPFTIHCCSYYKCKK